MYFIYKHESTYAVAIIFNLTENLQYIMSVDFPATHYITINFGDATMSIGTFVRNI